MKSRLLLKVTALLAVGVLLLAACGGDDDASTTGSSSGTRTIEIEMRDIEFSPDAVEVEAGETVRFVFHNKGEVVHDAFIGDEAAQDEHEMEMQEGDGDAGMDHGGDADKEGGITVEPGESGELTHTFEAGDEVLIGCHQPGHYDAGMKVTVSAS